MIVLLDARPDGDVIVFGREVGRGACRENCPGNADNGNPREVARQSNALDREVLPPVAPRLVTRGEVAQALW